RRLVRKLRVSWVLRFPDRHDLSQIVQRGPDPGATRCGEVIPGHRHVGASRLQLEWWGAPTICRSLEAYADPLPSRGLIVILGTQNNTYRISAPGGSAAAQRARERVLVYGENAAHTAPRALRRLQARYRHGIDHGVARASALGKLRPA